MAKGGAATKQKQDRAPCAATKQCRRKDQQGRPYKLTDCTQFRQMQSLRAILLHRLDSMPRKSVPVCIQQAACLPTCIPAQTTASETSECSLCMTNVQHAAEKLCSAATYLNTVTCVLGMCRNPTSTGHSHGGSRRPASPGQQQLWQGSTAPQPEPAHPPEWDPVIQAQVPTMLQGGSAP